MALYRTYRPTTFEDVAGQEQVISTLRNAVQQDKVAHAYLFAGTRGTGKTSTARILAKHLLTRGVTDTTVAEHIRHAVDEGSLVDLVEIDAASNTSVDHVRDLIEKIQFSPLVASAKVYIIDEVHMLSKSAFNALLKTLEEPPSYAYFILATTELHKIPATIQSRCQRFLFRPITEKDIAARLRFIADSEGIAADDDALHAIAVHASGGMRDAVSLLDQLRSLEHIGVAEVRERVGESGYGYAEHMLAAMDAGDTERIVSLTRELESTGASAETFIRLMLSVLQDRLHAAAKGSGDVRTTLRRIDLLLEAAKDVRVSPLPGLTLEAALVASASPHAAPASPTPPAPAENPPMPHSSAPTVPDATARTPAAMTSHTPVPTPSVATSASGSPSLTLQMLRDMWPDIVALVPSPAAKMSLKNAQIHDLAGDVVLLSFGSSFHRDKVAETANAHAIEQVLRAQTGRALRLKCSIEGEIFAKPASAPVTEPVDVMHTVHDVFDVPAPQ